MIDLSALGNVKTDPTDWGTFDKQTTMPPAKDKDGRNIIYYGQLPTEFTPLHFGTDKDGYLTLEIDPIVLVSTPGGEWDGMEVRFSKVSTKPFTTKAGKALNVHSFGRFLRAAGVLSTPQTPQEYAEAAVSVAGKIIPIHLDWRVYDKESQWSLNGYDKFPINTDGTRNPSVVCPHTDKRLRANLQARFFTPQD